MLNYLYVCVCVCVCVLWSSDCKFSSDQMSIESIVSSSVPFPSGQTQLGSFVQHLWRRAIPPAFDCVESLRLQR